jgi:short chain dehydrogenase
MGEITGAWQEELFDGRCAFFSCGSGGLVSGASRGIGRAIAEGFAERGARVVITWRERGTLDQTAGE